MGAEGANYDNLKWNLYRILFLFLFSKTSVWRGCPLTLDTHFDFLIWKLCKGTIKERLIQVYTLHSAIQCTHKSHPARHTLGLGCRRSQELEKKCAWCLEPLQ